VGGRARCRHSGVHRHRPTPPRVILLRRKNGCMNGETPKGMAVDFLGQFVVDRG
jgi:hypothetical protein